MRSHITIKEPCHENWEQMSVSEKSRFCAFCKKHVYDFTNSSLTEIKTAYQENNGSLCGRISAKQLRDQYVQAQIQRNHSGYLKRFFFATLFCFGASLFTIDSAKANTLQDLKQSFFHLFPKVETDTITIKGKVTDKDSKETIPFAVVSLLNKDSIIYKTTTDFDGNYSFKITNNNFSSVDLEVRCIGYTNQKIKNISLTNKTVYINLNMHMHAPMLGIIVDPNYVSPPINQQPGPSGKTFTEEEFRSMPK